MKANVIHPNQHRRLILISPFPHTLQETLQESNLVPSIGADRHHRRLRQGLSRGDEREEQGDRGGRGVGGEVSRGRFFLFLTLERLVGTSSRGRTGADSGLWLALAGSRAEEASS